MELHIYDSLRRRKLPFKPLIPGRVGLYVCGITVYDYCHIGHARVQVAFDVIVRSLKLLGYEVNYVRNITDIDDKILARAAQTGQHYRQLTQHYTEAMHSDFSALSTLPPDSEPRATDHIDGCIELIARLIESGHAYCGDGGDVFFAVNRFADYGRLSGRRLDELVPETRVKSVPGKRDIHDFALWKGCRQDQVNWDAPWGCGRPGWHIECSAMSMACLGESFDIHGGGPDLLFPHHENEIAQSEAVTGKTFARYWLHVGPVRIGQDNEDKMSKSRGNVVEVREVLNNYPAEVLRWLLLASHYRSPIDYWPQSLQTAQASLQRLYRALEHSDAAALPVDPQEPFCARFLASIADDFNMPKALAVLFDIARAINSATDQPQRNHLAGLLRGCGRAMELLQDDPDQFLQSCSTAGSERIDPAQIEQLIAARNRARVEKNYEQADRIRSQLADSGVELEDRQSGATVWHYR